MLKPIFISFINVRYLKTSKYPCILHRDKISKSVFCLGKQKFALAIVRNLGKKKVLNVPEVFERDFFMEEVLNQSVHRRPHQNSIE